MPSAPSFQAVPGTKAGFAGTVPGAGPGSGATSTVETASGQQVRLVQYPHMALTQPSYEVAESEWRSPTFASKISKLVQSLTALRCFSICAPKTKWPVQIIVVKIDSVSGEYDCFVNPTAPGYDDQNRVAPMYGMWENDGSMGNVTAWVIRPQQVVVTARDEYGVEKTQVLRGLKARLFMHEFDFLRGTTFVEHALSSDFVMSSTALYQKSVWPIGFPSMEAHMTDQQMFFDYTTNQVVLPEGLEWLHGMNAAAAQFHFDGRLGA